MERPKPPITKKDQIDSVQPAASPQPEGPVSPIENSVYTAVLPAESTPYPARRKSAKKNGLEEAFNEPLEDILRRMYLDESKSSYQIAKELNVSAVTVYKWLLQEGIPKRTRLEASELMWQQDGDQIKEKMSVTHRQKWAENKDELIKNIHSESARKKRSVILKRRFATDPEFRKKRLEVVKRAKQVQSENVQARREAALGKDEKRTLLEMHHTDQLTIEEIAQRTGFYPESIRRFLLNAGINPLPKADKRVIGIFQLVQQLLWSKPEAFQTLDEQEKIVINDRFLSDGGIPTLEAVGEQFRVSRQRVNQIEKKAIEKIQLYVDENRD